MEIIGSRDVLIILAAGVGKRLGELTADRPKWLTEVGQESIARRQLDSLQAAFERDESRILVVSGHGADEIRAFLDRDGYQASIVHNSSYREVNNWLSVLVGLQAIVADDWDRVFLLNSDLFADAEIYRDFVLRVRGSDVSGGWLAVDRERALTDESMKVGLGEDGRLDELGKTGVARPVGEYIGMAAMDRATAEHLIKEFNDWVGVESRTDDWYEGGILETARQGIPWHAVATVSGNWVEVDDLADLEAARRLAEHGH